MAFMILGIVLLVLKMTEIGPVATWSWWWVLLPFVLATVWWAFADSTGLTKARAMRKMEERKLARRERDMEALGLNTRRAKRVQAIREAARRAQGSEARPKVSADPKDEGRRS